LQCILFLVSIAGTTGMNMSVENSMLLPNSIKKEPTHAWVGPFLICLVKEMQHIILYAHILACSPSYTNEE